jgi:hypothetical protein
MMEDIIMKCYHKTCIYTDNQHNCTLADSTKAAHKLLADQCREWVENPPEDPNTFAERMKNKFKKK